MDIVLQSLTYHESITLFILTVGLVISLLFSIGIFLRLRTLQRGWKILWGSSERSTLEAILLEHFDERVATNASIRAIEDRLENVEELIQTSKRFLGLVRFDAFPDVAGSQSFSLAVFDDRGDGAILSSIVGRNSCRVYCKPIVGGRSERDLSQEEQRAIRSAKEGGVRMILSP
jgi:hypothetical protein